MSKFTFTEMPPGEQETQPREEPALLPAHARRGLGAEMVGLGLSHGESWGITSPQSGWGPGVYIHVLLCIHAPRAMSKLRCTAVLG